MIISKNRIVSAYQQFSEHQDAKTAIEATAAKLGITEQQVIDVIEELVEV